MHFTSHIMLMALVLIFTTSCQKSKISTSVRNDGGGNIAITEEAADIPGKGGKSSAMSIERAFHVDEDGTLFGEEKERFDSVDAARIDTEQRMKRYVATARKDGRLD